MRSQSLCPAIIALNRSLRANSGAPPLIGVIAAVHKNFIGSIRCKAADDDGLHGKETIKRIARVKGIGCVEKVSGVVPANIGGAIWHFHEEIELVSQPFRRTVFTRRLLTALVKGCSVCSISYPAFMGSVDLAFTVVVLPSSDLMERSCHRY